MRLLSLALAFCATALCVSVDLATESGLAQVQGRWRYSDTRIVETKFKAAGPDGQPSERDNIAYDFEPHAGTLDFDDSSWEIISPQSLSQRRTNGRLAFNWYRLSFTVPENVRGFSTRGATLTFETSLDDYAEIWVDGELTRAFGQQGGSMIAGWNATNRVVIGRNLTPGQKIQLAIFGINGPLSSPPTNYIFMRSALLHFEPGSTTTQAIEPAEVNIEVQRLDPSLDRIVPRNAKAFKLAEGFQFTEGPVWNRREQALYFSDPNANTIYRYAHGKLEVFRHPSGYSGADIAEYKQPGSNGLTLDREGRLSINEHGNRRVVRLETNGEVSVLASHFEGRLLNSPNDLVYRSDGALFFTDPPFGLPRVFDDPRKELPFSGVYSLRDGKLQLLSKDLSGPNGLAFSPDERFLYVGNWDEKSKVILRYPVRADATLGEGELFFDMTGAPGEDALDGLKVDRAGNLYASGPGGLWILSPTGRHLGTIVLPRHPHNFAWGDDGKSLYVCARSALYRIPLLIEGLRP
jgi:gluconolactonase